MSQLSLFFNISLSFLLSCVVFFPPGWSTTGKVMTYLPQLGRSQSGTGRVLTQCPSRAFLSLISMIMLLPDQWREPWKTQLPGSPFPFLIPLSCCRSGVWLRELYSPALLKRVLPANGTQAWESLTAGWRSQSRHVLWLTCKRILMNQVIASTFSCHNSSWAAVQKTGSKNFPTLYKSMGKGRWLWMSLPWQESKCS